MARGFRFLCGLAALLSLFSFAGGCSRVGPERAFAQDETDAARFERLRKEAADAFGRNDWSQNVALSQQALEIAGRTKVPANSEAKLRTNLGQAYRALGKWREGVVELERAQALFAASEKGGEKAGVTLFVRFQVASTYYFVSTETDHSAPVLERAFELNQSYWNVAEPVSHIDKGVRGFLRDSMKYVVELHYRSGFSRPEAVSDIERVIRTLDQPDESDLRAMAQFRLAILFEGRQENDKAERYYREALLYFERAGADKDSLGYAAIIHNDLGSIYYNRLQLPDAWAEMRLAMVRLSSSSGVQRDIAELIRAQAITVEGVANPYTPSPKVDRELTQWLRDAETRNEVELQAFLHTSLGSRALARAALGKEGKPSPSVTRDLAEAERHGRTAVSLAKAANFKFLEAIAQHNLGEVAAFRQNWAVARDRLTAAASLLSEGNRRANLAITSTALGYAYHKLHLTEKAQQAYEVAIQQFEAIARQVANPAEAAAIRHPAADPYALLADLLRSEGRFEDATRCLERGRAQGLARQALFSKRRLSHTEQQQWAQAVAAQDRAWKAFTDTRGKPTAVREAARLQFARCESQLNLLKLRLEERDSALKAVDFRPPSEEQIKALESNPRTLYLNYALVDHDRAFVLALGPGVKAAIGGDGIAAFSLPGRTAITRTLARWRESVTAPVIIERYRNADPKVTEAMAARAQKARDDEPARASAAGRALLGSLETRGLLDRRFADRIVVAGDGPFLAIPFAALRDRSGNRLVDRFAVASRLRLTPFSFASESRRTAPAARPMYRLVYAANPPTQGASSDQRRLMAGATEPLPRAERTAQNIGSRHRPCLALPGAKAREAAVKQAMTQAETLLFATHGWYERDFGLHSWLALAPEKNGGTEDGLLEAREILGLPLRAKLAVLMACQSGEGDAATGEGLLGFVWSFWAAGCPRVVASGWPVDENASALLVDHFFAAQEKGEPVEKALRTAMGRVRGLKVDGKKLYEHPFYWAGFQIFEDARAGSR